MAGVDPEEIALVRAVFEDFVDDWVRRGRPMPRTVTRARGVLDRAWTCAMSLRRQEIDPDEVELNQSIGTDEAARLLGVTRRTAQRNAESWGGQRVSGSWVFDRDEIEGQATG
jgi:hypothetical protein